MSWFDWLIVVVPIIFVYCVGIYCMRFVRGVADFLAAGRVCGRYVLCVGDVANALSIIGMVSYIEIHYRTGFALAFWSSIMTPLGIFMSLMGFFTYRFRETRALSLGQFLEMRYSRGVRIFASGLRSVAEMLANMIMPAIAARFFIYFWNLPSHFNFLGLQINTFVFLCFFFLTIAISLICMGGTLILVITDAVQGMFCYPILAIFIIYIMCKLSWSNEILPVMMDRAEGESFLNPFDLSKLRDFNLFHLCVTFMATILHRGSWIGAGTSTAAKTPHEQKMAHLLGTFRSGAVTILYILIAIFVLTTLNHKHYATEAREIRQKLSQKVANEVIEDEKQRAQVMADIAQIPELVHEIGKDEPLSQKKNLDTVYLDAAQKTLSGTPENNKNFQRFRTLFNQLMDAEVLRKYLPPGLAGLFALLMVLAMISTDDTRIFSATLTIAQDCILPFKKKQFTPKQHIWMIRIVAICVGVIFICGSSFMSQMDYISLFVSMVCSLWMGGCGPVMLFGLYSRFGTTAGAWTSLLSGMIVSGFTIFLQRGWAGIVYPWLERHELVEGVGNFLTTVSKPFNPYILWEMNPVKCPINSYEFYFMTMVISLALYCLVSWLTLKEPFNLDRMLHRGIYNVDGEKKAQESWTLKTVFRKIIGITPEYTTGDKVIAWSVFGYSLVYGFGIMFLATCISNMIHPWLPESWGLYFHIKFLSVPCAIASFCTFFFFIMGLRDLIQLFKDLQKRKVNDLDNGTVCGNVSIVDQAAFDKVEQGKKEASVSEDNKQ
ncbi:MAG: hypothetical protein J5746_12505 [Victivallales bacterium]|nr:hypothetical protein [Victivallales bacterium]